MDTLEYLRDLNLVSITLRCFAAIIFGGVIGLDRERKHRPAGFRTYMLVCLGSAMIMMISQYLNKRGYDSDIARLGAQVISGIGFLGAGTIIITGRLQVRGMTTAAGLWASACIGLAIGIGFYEGALIGFLFVVVVIMLLNRLGKKIKGISKYIQLYIEMTDTASIGDLLEFLKEKDIKTEVVEIGKNKSHEGGHAFVIVNLSYTFKTSHSNIVEMINGVGGIYSIEEI